MPVEGQEEAKQTNEIGMFIPLLDGIDIQGKDITADALLTQRKLAHYLVERLMLSTHQNKVIHRSCKHVIDVAFL